LKDEFEKKSRDVQSSNEAALRELKLKMDKERESAIQREKEERAEEIISLKNEHEKML
jgi:hypothetical protein